MNATFRLFFLVISCLVWTARASYAAQQADSAKRWQETRSHRTAVKNSPRRAADIAKASPPQRRPSGGKRSTSSNGVTVLQTVPKGTSAAAEEPRGVTPPVNAARVVRSPSLSGPFGQLPNNERHRGANPATVGGTASFVVRSAGVLNGTRVNRKP